MVQTKHRNRVKLNIPGGKYTCVLPATIFFTKQYKMTFFNELNWKIFNWSSRKHTQPIEPTYTEPHVGGGEGRVNQLLLLDFRGNCRMQYTGGSSVDTIWGHTSGVCMNGMCVMSM